MHTFSYLLCVGKLRSSCDQAEFLPKWILGCMWPRRTAVRGKTSVCYHPPVGIVHLSLDCGFGDCAAGVCVSHVKRAGSAEMQM